MLFYKSITSAQAVAANEIPLPTVVHDAPGVSYTTYGYYVDQVVDELLANPDLGATRDERVSALFSGGLKIYTNEVPSLQSYAQKVAVADIPPSLRDVAAAFVVMDPRTGDVEALVGGPVPAPTSSTMPPRGYASRVRVSSSSRSLLPSRAATTSMTRSWVLLPAPSCSPGCRWLTATT